MYEIENELWHVCKICESKIKDLAKKYGGCGIYFPNVFIKHLEIDHNITPEEYFEKFSVRPKCCKDCNKLCDIKKPRSAKMLWKRMCGRFEGQKEWSEKAKITRKGSGNPMYGKQGWCKGLTSETNESLRIRGLKARGRKTSDETRKKMSEISKKCWQDGKMKGMTGRNHSDKTKEKLRQTTLNSIKRGVFNQLKSKPHIKFKDILNNLSIKFVEEKLISYWSFDFYLIDYDIYIEVDGDYFHSNPNTRWPYGPKSKTQIKVKKNDERKNKFCEENNLNLIRFWENDIMKNTELVIEKIKCLVQK